MKARSRLALQAVLQGGEVARYWLEAVVFAVAATSGQVALQRIAVEGTQIEDHLVSKVGAEAGVEINLQRRRHWQQVMIQMQAPLDVVDEQLARRLVAQQVKGLANCVSLRHHMFWQVHAVVRQKVLRIAPGQVTEQGDALEAQLAQGLQSARHTVVDVPAPDSADHRREFATPLLGKLRGAVHRNRVDIGPP
ncbi:hypothetical protein D3C78_1213260 [compost metagenome]